MYCIKLLGIFDLNTEKNTFILLLTKETGLLNKDKLLKDKNILSIKSLLKTALYCGNFIKDGWIMILDCISKLDYLNVIGSRTRKDSEIFGGENKRKNSRDETIDFANSEAIINNIDPGNIDKIFHGTT